MSSPEEKHILVAKTPSLYNVIGVKSSKIGLSSTKGIIGHKNTKVHLFFLLRFVSKFSFPLLEERYEIKYPVQIDTSVCL